MQTALRLTGIVQPGSRAEVFSPSLPDGQAGDVIVLFSQPLSNKRRSVMDVLAEAPGHPAFQTAEEVETYVRKEREAGDC